MTAPQTDSDDLYQRIANSALANLPEKWQTAQITIYMLSSLSHLEAEYTNDTQAAPGRFVPSFDAVRAFEGLRELTAQPGKGAWYSAVFTMDRAGTFNVEFDYDTKPSFPYKIDDEDYREDLEAFPRDPEHIPDWMPVR